MHHNLTEDWNFECNLWLLLKIVADKPYRTYVPYAGWLEHALLSVIACTCPEPSVIIGWNMTSYQDISVHTAALIHCRSNMSSPRLHANRMPSQLSERGVFSCKSRITISQYSTTLAFYKMFCVSNLNLLWAGTTWTLVRIFILR